MLIIEVRLFCSSPLMDCCCSSSSLSTTNLLNVKHTPFYYSSFNSNFKRNKFTSSHPSIKVIACSYQKFIHFALNETKQHTPLFPSPLQESYNSLTSLDGKTELQMTSFQGPKIRLLRSFSIEMSGGIQVLDFAVFPEPEFDLPIFCANFFSAANTNVVVL